MTSSQDPQSRKPVSILVITTISTRARGEVAKVDLQGSLPKAPRMLESFCKGWNTSSGYQADICDK